MDASNAPWLFALLFPCGWVGVTTLLALQAGWFPLMRRYPDRPEIPLAEFKELSGSMGAGTSMNRILRLSPCPSGLRVGILRLFGPFCRDFFVPWEDITVERKDGFLGRRAVLTFRGVTLGRLVLAAHLADQLRRAAPQHWPETGPLPEKEPKAAVLRELFRQWALTAGIVVVFFSVVPRVMDPRMRRRPPAGFDAAIFLFLPTCIGAAFAYEYWLRTRD